MRSTLLGIAFLGCLITSCKKSNETPPVEINKEKISGTYMLRAKKMSATGIPEQDAFQTMDECYKDDLYIFKADNSFQYLDSGITCNSGGGYISTWDLNENLITFAGETGTVTRFNGSMMEVTVKITSAETIYTIKSTYTRH